MGCVRVLNMEFASECGEEKGVEFECQCEGELCCEGKVLTERGDEGIEDGCMGMMGNEVVGCVVTVGCFV